MLFCREVLVDCTRVVYSDVLYDNVTPAPSKPEFFFFFFFQASFSAISLIAVYLRGSIRYLSPTGLIYDLFHILFVNVKSRTIKLSKKKSSGRI